MASRVEVADVVDRIGWGEDVIRGPWGPRRVFLGCLAFAGTCAVPRPAAAFLVTPAFVTVSVERGKEAKLEFTLQGTRPAGVKFPVRDPVRLRLVDFEIDVQGSLRFPVRDGWKHSVRPWITPASIDQVDLTSEHTTTVAFTLLAPMSATPGTYYGGLEIQPIHVDETSNVQWVPRAVAPMIVEVVGGSRRGIEASVSDARISVIPTDDVPPPRTQSATGGPVVPVGGDERPSEGKRRSRAQIRLSFANESSRALYPAVRANLRAGGRVVDVVEFHPSGAYVPKLLGMVMPEASRDFVATARRFLPAGEYVLDTIVDLGAAGQFRKLLPLRVTEETEGLFERGDASPLALSVDGITAVGGPQSIASRWVEVTNVSYQAVGVRVEVNVPWLVAEPAELVRLEPGVARRIRVRIVRPPTSADGAAIEGVIRFVPTEGRVAEVPVRIQPEPVGAR